MAGLTWTIVVVLLVVSADHVWVSWRDWRGRRLAVKRGRTLTAKFMHFSD
jgi:hypothetical protein